MVACHCGRRRNRRQEVAVADSGSCFVLLLPEVLLEGQVLLPCLFVGLFDLSELPLEVFRLADEDAIGRADFVRDLLCLLIEKHGRDLFEAHLAWIIV